MKATGIVRKVDELGRVVIPIELRRTLDMEIKDALEIFVDQDQIILKKYQPCCVLCGEYRDTVYLKNKLLCKDCVDEIKEQD
ncbi:AbrB/MazE/SpoVT family DNA-binding domain-containing protein [Fusibacter sp. JL298sf-3]